MNIYTLLAVCVPSRRTVGTHAIPLLEGRDLLDLEGWLDSAINLNSLIRSCRLNLKQLASCLAKNTLGNAC